MSTCVIERSIDRAVRMLSASGAKYRIITPDGETIGELEWARPRKKSPRADRPYGALSTHMKPFITNMRPGDVVQIPYAGFEREHLRGAIAAHLSNTWGPGTYNTCLTKEHVEVLRIS